MLKKLTSGRGVAVGVLAVLIVATAAVSFASVRDSRSETPAAASARQETAPVATSIGSGTLVGMTSTTYTDPFAYCGAVGDMLHPDSRYAGPAIPDTVVRSLEKALNSKPGTLDSFARNGAVYWRCQGGEVLGCFPGANLQCWDANTSTTPTKGEVDWCAQHPGDFTEKAFIPMYVTGHTSIYEWRCKGTAPAIFRQVAEVDAAGLNARIWYRLSP